MEDPRVPPPPPLLSDDEIRRLQRVNRRAWGATLAATGLLLLAFAVAGLLFLLWIASLIDGSPTIG